ncbi:CBS domain-containing protein [Saccharopolyspora sp. SCSIO 74807]|uniref:CBS domain-containing protein n=1 Tax=Saccharopolyspora sp. SCSIO 74807 TaxID=3118084 RepID=UPI0030CAAC32
MSRAGIQCVGGGVTVADAMLHAPKVCGSATTVAQAREIFEDDHVHAVLVVDGGRLLAVVERPDISSMSPQVPAWLSGRLQGRVVRPDADLDAAWSVMTANQRRRLAVIDDQGMLRGLLCLKRTGLGFCSDADVEARASERRANATALRADR